MKRRFAVVDNLDTIEKKDYSEFIPPRFCEESEANLISSVVDDTVCHEEHRQHMPCIDIDLPCRLVESRTPGHFHLFIDCTMSWRKYRAILEALTNAGVVENGYLDASCMHKATFVRTQLVKVA